MNITVDAASATAIVWTGCLLALAISSTAPRLVTLDQAGIDDLLAKADIYPSRDDLLGIDPARILVILVPGNSAGSTRRPRVEVHRAFGELNRTVVLVTDEG